MRRTKNRWLAMVLAAVLVLGVVISAGCSGTETAATAEEEKSPFPTIDRIRASGKLRVGTSSGYFPFEMVDVEGNLIGFDIEMAAKIAEALGVELEVKDMDFTALIPALQAGTIDIAIAGMTITAERALTVNFTIPYFQTGQALLVNNKHLGKVKSWQDLDQPGCVIALAMGTTGDLLARELFKHAQLKQFEGASAAGMEVISGRADAMVFDQPWVAIYSKMNEEHVFGILDPISVENFGIAVAPGQWDFLWWLNTFLYSFVGTQEYERMFQYWFVDMPWLERVEVEQGE